MIRNRKNSGFTLIELMIVVAIIAIIASIAIPKLMSARLSANEAAAISTLRSISSSQATLQSSGAIDSDADGGGEYGYFAEMAGTVPMRTSNAGAPAAGVAGTDELSPAVLASAFGSVDANGFVSRSGYYFQLWLPGATAGGVTPGVGEAANGGADAANFPDSDNCEIMWACYAWPMDVEGTGNRVFFINQEGDLLQCQNRAATPYNGTTSTPGFDEAFQTAGDMASGLRIGTAGGTDNTIWTPVQ
jgi:prepilin-type N-terminal cleavage/methylation domain-containing protein